MLAQIDLPYQVGVMQHLQQIVIAWHWVFSIEPRPCIFQVSHHIHQDEVETVLKTKGILPGGMAGETLPQVCAPTIQAVPRRNNCPTRHPYERRQ